MLKKLFIFLLLYLPASVVAERLVGDKPQFLSTNHLIYDESSLNLLTIPHSCQNYLINPSNNWSCLHYERRKISDIKLEIEKAEIKENLRKTKEANALVQQGDRALQREDYPKAERSYRQAIKLKSDLAASWIKLAAFYVLLDRDKDALQILQNGLETIADNADMYFDTGLIQVRLRMLSDAVVSLANAALLAPENAHYSYVYGIAMNSYQRPDKALEILKKALSRHTDSQQILTALISINQDNNHEIEALKYAEKLLELEPDNGSYQRFVEQLKLEKNSANQ